MSTLWYIRLLLILIYWWCYYNFAVKILLACIVFTVSYIYLIYLYIIYIYIISLKSLLLSSSKAILVLFEAGWMLFLLDDNLLYTGLFVLNRMIQMHKIWKWWTRFDSLTSSKNSFFQSIVQIYNSWRPVLR